MAYRSGPYASQNPKSLSQGLFDESSTQKQDLGTCVVLADGRAFRYCLNAGTALATGKVISGGAVVGNHLNQAVAAAAAVDAYEVSVTLGGTAATADQYKEGFLNINDAAGEGHCYKIRGHAAIAASGTGTIKLFDKIREALTTSSEYTLIAHPCANTVVGATTLVNKAVGVTTFAVTASYYFWAQFRGPAAVLISGSVVAGNPVALIGASGAVGPRAAIPDEVLGHVIAVNATTEYGAVWREM